MGKKRNSLLFSNLRMNARSDLRRTQRTATDKYSRLCRLLAAQYTSA